MTGFNSKRDSAADKMQEPVREALMLALEALDNMHIVDFPLEDLQNWNKAITAIKEALAQPAQEPVDIASIIACREMLDAQPVPAQEPLTEREALKLALEALEAMQMYAAAERKGLRICDEAIITVKEALAQPAQEPVAWMYQCTADNSGSVLLCHRTNWAENGSGLWTETPLYTTPPLPVQPAQELVQRPWAGLTDEEIDAWTPEIHGVIRSIEQALKEKNGCA
jgi:hypothetical protein